MALNVDKSMNSVFDEVADELMTYCKSILTDKKQALEFIKEFNKVNSL
jgi:hypothetical protein